MLFNDLNKTKLHICLNNEKHVYEVFEEFQINPFTAVYKCTQYAGGNMAILML